MRKYYLVKVIYKGVDGFLIWYSGSASDEDGFVLHNQRLAVFATPDGAREFAGKNGFMIEAEAAAIYDFSTLDRNIAGFADNVILKTARTYQSVQVKNMAGGLSLYYLSANPSDVQYKLSENCNMLLDAWNFFGDLAKTLNEEFAGDSEEMIVTDIYDKLFYGCNLEVLKRDGEEYHPTFNNQEMQKCISVLQSGFSILDKALAGKYEYSSI